MSSLVPGVESGSVEAEPSRATLAPPPLHSAVAGAVKAACGPEPVTRASARSVVRWNTADAVNGSVLPSVAVIASAYGFAGTSVEISIAGGRPEVNGTSMTALAPAMRTVTDPGSIARMVQSTPGWRPPIGRTQTVAGSDSPESDSSEAKPTG